MLLFGLWCRLYICQKCLNLADDDTMDESISWLHVLFNFLLPFMPSQTVAPIWLWSLMLCRQNCSSFVICCYLLFSLIQMCSQQWLWDLQTYVWDLLFCWASNIAYVVVLLSFGLIIPCSQQCNVNFMKFVWGQVLMSALIVYGLVMMLMLMFMIILLICQTFSIDQAINLFWSLGQADHSQLPNTFSVWQLVAVGLSARLRAGSQTWPRLGRALSVHVHKQVLLHHLGQACSGLVQFGWPGHPGAGSQMRPTYRSWVKTLLHQYHSLSRYMNPWILHRLWSNRCLALL
jgi:hypothetical protein